MRAFCTVSAPFEVCAPPTRPLSPGSRFLALRLLGTPQPQTLYYLVEAKSRIREVYAQTCLHFAKQGMLDTELFGLAVLIDGEYMFADPESKLSKYGPKSWRSSHTHGLDANGRPLLELHFRVQFYIESPFMLRDEASRHNYYLQLKSNSISRDVPKEYSEQSMILLGGLALQADLGNCPADDDCIEENGRILTSSSSSSSVGIILSRGGCGDGDGIKSINTTNNSIAIRKIHINSKCNSVSSVNSININREQINNSNNNISSIMTSSLATTNSTTSAATTSSSSIITNATSSSSSVVTDVSNNNNNQSIDYFRIDEYLPPSIHSTWSASALRSCHRENRGMSQSDAKLNYIRQACSLHEAINAHVYRMKLSKNECGNGSVWFVVYAKGIRIYGDNTQPITFLWPNIVKLSFERKRFEIRSGENKITLYSVSDEKNKLMLSLCKETHQFSMKIATRLKEAIRREEEENNCLDYIYSRSLHLPYKNKNDQRISVISSTSSNTTSGIVSDRVHSEDELEIMINTPPAIPIAAPSTESLALAHLLDSRPSVSRQTSSAGQVSLKDLEDHLAALSVRSKTKSISSESTNGIIISERITERQNSERSRGGLGGGNESTETDSPNSHHNIGSQCSSTCSTVVVATDTITLSSLAAHTTATNRRPSTSSSLELGFSHTAQNSALSEDASTCVDHEYITTNDGDENASGVYTLEHGAPPTETSGVYTMNSSEMTGQSSEIAESESHESSHYGTFQPKNNDIDEGVIENSDSVDGGANNYNRNRMKTDDMSEFRMRSDSNISTSGSFRGDGSDPTDNKHTLLTAEELTDLIVGRGTYPSRKSVSNTLDSDCDYVTLPLTLEGDSYIQGHEDTAPTDDNIDMMDEILPTDPPVPPKRIDSNMHHSLSSLVDIRMRSPPPYNARHETTGLCGPPIRKNISNITSNLPVIPIPSVSMHAAPPIELHPIRDPPPYPQQPVKTQVTPAHITSAHPTRISKLQKHSKVIEQKQSAIEAVKAEEATARFITTRPHINILKAHTSVINDNAKPSYAAPTIPNMLSSSTSIAATSQLQHQNIPPPPPPHATTQQQPQQHHHHHHHHHTQNPIQVGSQMQTVSSTIGIPIVPYSIHNAHKSMSSIPPPPPPTYHHDVVKTPAPRTCVLLPVIKPRQYLPPPPPTLPRQPPPPPPHQLATVYTGQLARSQIELYQQQLYSDVDYVIYPLQDPAVSQQEYLDAKQGSILAAMAQSPPPPPYLAYHAANPHTNTWDACKGHAIYRSTPYLPMALSHHSRYASTQNLSDTYVQLPGAYSPLYSPSVASLCSSYEPPPPPPLRATTLSTAQTLFSRSRSDDNILNSIETMPKMKRLPPPPPPPYVNRRVKKPPMPVPTEKPPPIPMKTSSHHQHIGSNTKICSNSSSTLPYQSSHLKRHFPTTLSKFHQYTPSAAAAATTTTVSNYPTNLDQHSTTIIPSSSSIYFDNQITPGTIMSSGLMATSTGATTITTPGTTASTTTSSSSIDIQILLEKSRNMDLPLISALCNDRSLLKQTKAFVMPKHPRNSLHQQQQQHQQQQLSLLSSPGKSSSNNKYPVSGLSTTQLTKPRKTSISHRHPNDKLPPLPKQQTAEANNYVMDPTPSLIKHKSYNSQPSI